jgi:hypothetical protein
MQGLRDLAAATIARLNGIGIGRNDRVAIVLPNGPEMAAAFIAIGAGATTAPLNPAYRADEFNFYLTDLKAKALVVQKGVATEARDVAAKLGVAVLELVPGEHAGSFTLEGGSGTAGRGRGRRYRAGAAYIGHHGAAQDCALVSGEYLRLGPAYRRDTFAFACRCLPQHHAAVSHSRADRGGAFFPRRRWRGDLHAGL